MGPIRRRFASGFGPPLLLTVIAAVSVSLNMDMSAVPRFDGAGYAVLGQALGAGRGYREINQPGTPRHDHFPPGYPIALCNPVAIYGPLGRGCSFILCAMHGPRRTPQLALVPCHVSAKNGVSAGANRGN